MGGLELRWAGGGQFDEVVIEERHSALQTPRHRHVVDALDRIVDQHHRGVQPQRAVDSGLGAGAGEVLGDELPARIALGEVSRCGTSAATPAVVPVEERGAVAGHRRRRATPRPVTHRGIPVVAGEHLVGALPGLHHLDVLGDFLAEQIEGDAVVADHRLAHRADRAVERGQHPVGADADLVVIGVEALGDDVGVLELVALRRRRPTRSRSRTSTVRVWPASASRPTIRLESTPPDSRQPDRHVGDQAALDGGAQRRENGVLPVTFGPVGAFRRGGVKSGSQYVVVVRLCPSGSIATSDAGGTLDTPRRIVRGGGTTEWKDR